MHTQSERSAIRTRNALQVRAVELRAADVHQDQRAVLVAVELPSSNDASTFCRWLFPIPHYSFSVISRL